MSSNSHVLFAFSHTHKHTIFAPHNISLQTYCLLYKREFLEDSWTVWREQWYFLSVSMNCWKSLHNMRLHCSRQQTWCCMAQSSSGSTFSPVSVSHHRLASYKTFSWGNGKANRHLSDFLHLCTPLTTK